MGNIIEVRYMKKTSEYSMQKPNKDSYVVLSAGESRRSEYMETRAKNLTSVSQSLANSRDLFSINITDTSRRLWVILTYKENMQNNERLYQDFRRLYMRMLHYLKKHSLSTYEYIAAMEPQGHGTWHIRLVMTFPYKAPFTPSDILAGIQGHGFTRTKPLEGMDDVKLYLTAHLIDMELLDVISSHDKIYGNLKTVPVVDGQDNKQTKVIVKDVRSKLYPSESRIYRTGQGVRKPEVINCAEAEAIKEVGNVLLTFERTIKVIDDSGKGFNIINYR